MTWMSFCDIRSPPPLLLPLMAVVRVPVGPLQLLSKWPNTLLRTKVMMK